MPLKSNDASFNAYRNRRGEWKCSAQFSAEFVGLLAVGNEDAIRFLANTAQVALIKIDQAGELDETIKEQIPDFGADPVLDKAEPPRDYADMLVEAFATQRAEASRQ